MRQLNAITMTTRFKVAALFMLLPQQPLHAMEFTGRFSMLGATAVAEEGDIGYQPMGSDTLSADQQSLRLMWDDVLDNGEWSLHLRGVRQHRAAIPSRGPGISLTVLFTATVLTA
jgi:hypothetical protein